MDPPHRANTATSFEKLLIVGKDPPRTFASTGIGRANGVLQVSCLDDLYPRRLVQPLVGRELHSSAPSFANSALQGNRPLYGYLLGIGGFTI